MRQLAIQGAAVLVVLSLAWPYYGLRGEALPWRETALIIGGVAFALARLARQPIWWRLMHGVFMPLAWGVAQWQIDPGWFLLAFFILLLIYRGAVSGQVPLYLSNAATVGALHTLLAERPAGRFIDLGSGLGSTVVPLAKALPAHQFQGVENAPLTWLLGWLRSRRQANLDWCWGSLWQTSLQEADVVYAFLSPAPMAELWKKVQTEMRPGSLFISNSFPVPEVEPSWQLRLPDNPHTLYGYER